MKLPFSLKTSRCLLAALGTYALLGGTLTSRAQFTISSAWLRIYATDGFGTFDNAGISITPPAVGTPAGTPLTSPANAISMMSYIYPSPAYTYTPSIGVATAQVNFNAFTWPGSSNYTGVPGAVGLISGALSQTGVGTPARLRLDWSITYSAAANYSLSASAIMTFAGSLGLGDYASFRLHDEYVPVSLATGFSSADNLPGGDTGGIYYIPPFWHREDPYTSGAFLDYTAGPPSGTLNVSTGGSFTENGFIDILVDPASVNFEVVPEPTTGLLAVLGGALLLFVRRRKS